MSLNKSRPQPRKDRKLAWQSLSNSPDYAGLVRFLVEPFLESPEALRVDCEVSPSKPRVWVRLAFETADKGRVYGRGGRNIQAIRTVLTAVARAAGQSLYLDVYGNSNSTDDRHEDSTPMVPRERIVPRPQVRRSPILKPERRSGFHRG